MKRSYNSDSTFSWQTSGRVTSRPSARQSEPDRTSCFPGLYSQTQTGWGRTLRQTHRQVPSLSPSLACEVFRRDERKWRLDVCASTWGCCWKLNLAVIWDESQSSSNESPSHWHEVLSLLKCNEKYLKFI